MPRPPTPDADRTFPGRSSANGFNGIDGETGFDSPIIGDAYSYWFSLCAGRPFPLRSEVDPIAMPRHLLPRVVLVDIIDREKPDFRWRLIGTYTTDLMGRDATGRIWSELYSPEDFRSVSEGPRHIISTGKPFRSVVRAPLREREFMMIEAIDLPLSSDGREIDMVLGFHDSMTGYL